MIKDIKEMGLIYESFGQPDKDKIVAQLRNVILKDIGVRTDNMDTYEDMEVEEMAELLKNVPVGKTILVQEAAGDNYHRSLGNNMFYVFIDRGNTFADTTFSSDDNESDDGVFEMGSDDFEKTLVDMIIYHADYSSGFNYSDPKCIKISKSLLKGIPPELVELKDGGEYATITDVEVDRYFRF